MRRADHDNDDDDNDDDMCMRNHCFFSFFANSGNLPTTCHMIDFLVNLAPNLKPKTHQKSTQEAPKIDNKRYSKHDASWPGIWSPLGTVLVGSWAQDVSQVGTKLAPKSAKNREPKNHQKMIKKK